MILIVVLYTSSITCAAITTKIKDELLSDLEQQHNAFDPSFGLKQLQHAATMMHNLWHNGENVYNNDQPIEIYVTRTKYATKDIEKYGTEEKRDAQDLPPSK